MKSKLFKLLAFVAVISMFAAPVGAQPTSRAPEISSIAGAAPLAADSDSGEKLGTKSAYYLVRLSSEPLASYRGGIAGLEATNPAARGERKLDAKSPDSLAYIDYLHAEQDALLSVMAATFGREIDVLFRYVAANNGFAAYLTPAEAAQVASMPGVVFIQRDIERELQTDAGPAWIGAPGIWDGTTTGGLPGTQGEGIIAGVIDTGINPSNPSFADVGGDGYDHTNPLGAGVYVGVCDPGDPTYDPTFPCNDKLIGARGYPSVNGGDPRDYDGHGSHTASTVAGNHYTATVLAPTITITRTISGVAPHANVVAYTACCTLSALSAAIDDVVLDGVDVVNYSIGSSAPSDPWNDFDAVGYLNARDAGIFVATSAGNNGPGDETLGSPGDVPWLTSVGASTHNRAFLNSLIDMTGGSTTPPPDLHGRALTSGYGPAPIVYAGDFGDALCLAPFPAGTWTGGEIVVCDRGIAGRVAKGINVAAGGASGYVLANTATAGGFGPGGLNGDSHVLPAVHLAAEHGDVLKAWLASGSGHMGTIPGTTMAIDDIYADIMAQFSSRGANRALPDIVVPSVTGPGVDIIAAYGVGDPAPPEWNVISGTSMSSPHTAGAGALMMSLHPTWTPAEIQSALMLTGDTAVVDNDGVTPANPFDQGSGRVALSDAAVTGLVMDVPVQDYWDADPSLGGDPKTLNLASMGNANCAGSCSWTRVFKNTQSTEVTWVASTTSAGGVVLTVDPITNTVSANSSFTLTITADTSGAGAGVWNFGEVLLTPQVEPGPTGFSLYLPYIPKASVPSSAPLGGSHSAAASLGNGLPTVHLPVATFVEEGDPVIEVDPDSLGSTQDTGITTTLPLTVSNVGGADLEWSIYEDNDALARSLVDWSDNFDSYTTGSQVHGQGGWKGWDNDVAFGALTSSTQALSAPNSVDILGASDLVHEYSGYDTGSWTYTAWQYIPTGYSGESSFILLNTYNDGGPYSWSVQVTFNSGTGMVENDGVSSGSLPILFDQWVELRAEIDLINDTQSFYYDNQLLYSGTWTNEVSVGGALNIGAVDLFANSASSVFYDDISLVEVSGACTAVEDIPWASANPNSGTTDGGTSTVVDVTLDSTGLSAGDYSGSLCVSSNDPVTPLVTVPVTMTVTGSPPIIEVSPSSMSSTQPADETITDTLTISNTGGADLIWSSFEDNGLILPAFPDAYPGGAGSPALASPDSGFSLSLNPDGANQTPSPAAPSVIEAPETGTVTITHSTSQVILAPNSVHCGYMGLPNHTDNSYLRRFTLGDFGITGDFAVSAVQVGIESAIAGSGGTQPSTVNLYTWDPLDPFTFANFNPIGSAPTSVADQTQTIITVPVSGVAPAGSTLVVEFFTPDGLADNHALWVGSNNLGQTSPTFIAAADCGIANPTDTAVIGQPQMQMVMNVSGKESSGPPPACSAPEDIPWLSELPSGGTIGAGGADDVVLTYDSTGLSTGTYTGTLCIDSNDPVTPLVEVPVELEVTSSGGTFVSTANPALAIPDDAYDGSQGTMVCSTIDASSIPGGNLVSGVQVDLASTHSRVGNLVAKLWSPDNSVLGVFSRPGNAEAADDGTGGAGDSSNLSVAFALNFSDSNLDDAETMGNTIGTNENVCEDDGRCSYFANPGAVVGLANFAGFNGENASGNWTLCLGDAAAMATGSFSSWTLTLDHVSP